MDELLLYIVISASSFSLGLFFGCSVGHERAADEYRRAISNIIKRKAYK